MGLPLQPGELVVTRVRWHPDATLMGIVIGQEDTSWLVMWTTDDYRISFKWHLADALWVIDSTNLQEVKKRCVLAS